MRAVINFYLTWRCNFFCAHCIHECGPNETAHMSKEQLDYAFNYMAWLKSKSIPIVMVGVTGGEPMLYPNFWDNFMERLAQARASYGIQNLEIHTNGSIPIDEKYKIKFNKFFAKVWIGHDPFHRKFKSLKELELQDYTDVAQEVILRNNSYVMGTPNGPEMASILRNKGRTAVSIKHGLLDKMPIPEKPDCSWERWPRGDSFHVAFTPTHVNHCGEKSHIYPEDEGKDHGQFWAYGKDYQELYQAAILYDITNCGNANCKQRCNAVWVQPK